MLWVIHSYNCNLTFNLLLKRTNAMTIPATRVVDLFLTYDCNCRCSYCFVQDSGKKISMKPEILDKAIDWIAETSEREVEIVFLGGEPTLKPLLIERAVNRALNWQRYSGKKFNFNMTTNALNIDEKLAANLAKWGIRYLFSIDGYGERHNNSRPSITHSDPFDALESKFAMLKKYQKYIAARMTILPKNVDWLAHDLQKLTEMGFDSFTVSPATGMKWKDEQLKRYIDEMVKFASGRPFHNGRPFPHMSPIDDPDQGKTGWGCSAGRGRFSVDPQGKIFACGRMTSLSDAQGLTFGDIYSGVDPNGNIKLFQDDTYESRLQCIDCHLREKCIGGCAAVNFETTGSPVVPAPDECRFAKAFETIKSLTNQSEFAL